MNKLFIIIATFSLLLIPVEGSNLTATDITNSIGITKRLNHQVAHDLEFTDSNGQTVKLSQFFQNERPTILSVVYYSCPILCSMLTDGKINVINQLDNVIGSDVNVISISFDAEDTLSNAKSFRDKHLLKVKENINKENWKFLRGSKETVQRLLDDIGYQVKYIPKQDEYAHPSGLVILKPNGQVSRYLNGMTFLPFDLKMSIIEAKTNQKVSLIEKGLLFCYSFDPDANSYTIRVLNLMKVAGIMTVIILALWIRFLKKLENARIKSKG